MSSFSKTSFLSGKLIRGFKTTFLYYGILQNKKNGVWVKTYSIEARKAPFKPVLYSSNVKPPFPFWVYNIIAFFNSVLQWIPACLIYVGIFLYNVFFGFMHQCLFRESFITGAWEKISGYLWLVLGLIGIASIIYHLTA